MICPTCAEMLSHSNLRKSNDTRRFARTVSHAAHNHTNDTYEYENRTLTFSVLFLVCIAIHGGPKMATYIYHALTPGAEKKVGPAAKNCTRTHKRTHAHTYARTHTHARTRLRWRASYCNTTVATPFDGYRNANVGNPLQAVVDPQPTEINAFAVITSRWLVGRPPDRPT